MQLEIGTQYVCLSNPSPSLLSESSRLWSDIRNGIACLCIWFDSFWFWFCCYNNLLVQLLPTETAATEADVVCTISLNILNAVCYFFHDMSFCPAANSHGVELILLHYGHTAHYSGWMYVVSGQRKNLQIR